MQNTPWMFAVLITLLQRPMAGRGFRCPPALEPRFSTYHHESSAKASEQGNDEKREVRNNKRVRDIMELLEDRYHEPADFESKTRTKRNSNNEWTKMQRFLYRATASPDCGLTLSKTRKVLEFLDEFVPERNIQRSIVLQSPRILTKNVRTRLRPTIDFLRSIYDDNLFLMAISRNPDLLLTSGTGYKGDDLDLVETFLRTELKINENCINKLKVSDPQFFQLSMTQILSVVKFLHDILRKQNDDESDIDCQQKRTKAIGGLVLSHPIIFQLSVEENLMPRISFLQDRCHLLDNDLASLLKSSSGAILGLSVKNNLEPTIDVLSSMLSVSDLRKSILSHPQILGLSVDNLKNKVEYFDAIDSMSEVSDKSKLSLASRILMKAPAAYSLSLQRNLVPTINVLAKAWGQPCPEQLNSSTDKDPRNNNVSNLASLLSECPSILTVSLDGNIMPTVYFYVRAGYLSLDSDGRLQPLSDGSLPILRGRYITASLFNRLLPRWHYYGKQKTEKPFVAPPLYILAGATDVEFCERFGFDFVDYIAFKEESIPRLKFSSQFETWIQSGRPIDFTV
jgi:mTERF